MHDGMPCDPIQGQGQGHGASEVPKIALFQVYLHRHLQWKLANDQCFVNWSTIYKFDLAGRIFHICPTFCIRALNLAVPAVSPSRKKVFPISMKFGVYIEVYE